MDRYFGDFESAEDVEQQWGGAGSLKDAQVIAAVYTNEDYSGDAWIVFIREGKYYEAHCSHCSCNGLDTWSPEETTYEALVDRLEKTTNYDVERYGENFAMAVRRGLLDEKFEREVLLS